MFTVLQGNNTEQVVGTYAHYRVPQVPSITGIVCYQCKNSEGNRK